MNLSLSTGIFSKLSLTDGLAAVRKLGFVNIEFNMKSVEKQEDDSTVPATSLTAKYGLKCLTVHSASLHVKDQTEVPTAVYYGLVSADFAQALSAPIMTVHSNISRKLPQNQRRAYLKAIFDELNPYAKSRGITLALENLSYASSGYGKNVSEMEEIMAIIDSDGNMGVTIDFCHALATGTTQSLLEKYHRRLCNVHMSNRAHTPFTAETPQLTAFLNALKENGYTGPVSLELSPKCTLEEVVQTKAVLEEVLGKINDLPQH